MRAGIGTSEGKLALSDGCQLFWRSDGDPGAPPVLLANSLGTDLGMWDDLALELARSHRVIRYDMRGHGQSSLSPSPFGIARLAADAIELIDSLSLAKVDFIGLSLGGMVGQWLGVHGADRIGRLVLANTSAFMGPPESWDARIGAVRAGGMEAIAGAIVERWFTAAFRLRSSAPDRILAMLLETDPEGYCMACAAIRDMDQRAHVAAITSPTMVIGGHSDPATPPDHAQFLAAAIPAAQLVMLDAAHLSNIEQPAGFLTAVCKFLARET